MPATVKVFFAILEENIIGFLSTECVEKCNLTWLRKDEDTSQVEIPHNHGGVEHLQELHSSRSIGAEGIENTSLVKSKRICDLPHVTLGIRQIWVHPSRRGRGVARHLINTARRLFLIGSIIRREHVAFSQPTVQGKRFAFAYNKEPERILTYSHTNEDNEINN